MLAVVRLHDGEQMWHGLYGTYLSLDERFCAVMLWTRRRDASAIQARLRQIAAANAQFAPASRRSEVRASSAWLPSSMVPGARLQKALASSLLGHSAFTRLHAPKVLDLAGRFRVSGIASLGDQLTGPRLDGLVSQVSMGIVPARHAHGDARAQVLLAVVALVGWAEVLLGVPAMAALARRLEQALFTALAAPAG